MLDPDGPRILGPPKTGSWGKPHEFGGIVKVRSQLGHPVFERDQSSASLSKLE